MTRPTRIYASSGEPGAVVDAVGALLPGPGDLVCVLVAEREAPHLERTVAALGATAASFFGGIFPALIDGREKRDSGVLAFTLPKLAEPMLVPGLDADDLAIPDGSTALEGHGGPKPTAVLLVDGLAPNVSRFLQSVYHQLGNRVSYWGGGAGSLAQRLPCVFTREGLRAGAGVIALSSASARLGVRHGWRELKGPFVATRAHHNTIVQLNWRNAFELYRAAVESDAGVPISPENFFTVASGYPFAIRKDGQEALVRDPVAVGEGGTLTCVGDVPENAVLSIHKGEPEWLVAAAAQAARDAHPETPTDVRHCLLADCVSRVLYLKDRFSEELAAIEEGLGPACGRPLGMLTLGEISSYGDGYLELFNKTCVVAVVHDP